MKHCRHVSELIPGCVIANMRWVVMIVSSETIGAETSLTTLCCDMEDRASWIHADKVVGIQGSLTDYQYVYDPRESQE